MKNYVISLNTEDKRREHIISEFSNKNVNFEFFDAINKNGVQQKLKEFNFLGKTTTLKDSEVACLLSHLSIIKKVVDENQDYVCIFEDDIHLGVNTDSYLKNSHWIPKDCEIVKIEAFYKKVITDKKSLSNHDADRHIYKLRSKHLGCGGYIISNVAARKIINYISNADVLIPIDHFIFNLIVESNEINVYQLLPALCIQDHILFKNHDNFPSALEKDRRERKQYKKQYKVKRKLRKKFQDEFQKVLFKISLIRKKQKVVHIDFK